MLLTDYEQECQKCRDFNQGLLDRFEDWLMEKNLGDKTVQKHVQNVEFYLNEFLLYEDTIPAKDGVEYIGPFLGDWFIRKALWSSVNTIKENASSLKKFYTFMYDIGEVDKDDLEIIKETIKEEMPDWLASMEKYESGVTDWWW